MKTTFTKIILSLFFLMITCYSFAQVPPAFNYQAVARDVSGNVIPNSLLGIKIYIHSTSATGPVVYSETQTPTTNQFGLFTIGIGLGTVVSGNFSTIPWGSDYYFIQVDMDPAGGTTYTPMGTSQLLTVPYAMYAKHAGKVSAFQPLGCQHLASVTTTYQKIANMGTFTKYNSDTYVELNFQSNFRVSAFASGCTGVIYELRIDDVATTFGKAALVLKSAATDLPGCITGVFSGLGPGTHTVSLWAKTFYSTATDAYYDPGCWNDYANSVIVKEF